VLFSLVFVGGQLISDIKTFGTAVSSAALTWDEQVLFTYNTSNPAAITHWWLTGAPNIGNAIIRFYIDGDTTATIELRLDMAAGIGFFDNSAPWGNSLIGKGAHTGGVFNNIRIPFYKNIKITLQQPRTSNQGVFWFIVRGAVNMPIKIGDLFLPAGARLRVLQINNTFAPLDKIDVIDYSVGPGALLMWTLQVASGSWNFLEGCVRCYIDNGPKMLLSSGTEDYFDSAFYFDAGPYTLPVSGLTHKGQDGNAPFAIEVSAYRFHIMDPIAWKSNFKLVWRNGDTVDPKNGQKCIDDNGNVVGNPTTSMVNTYAWVYLW